MFDDIISKKVVTKPMSDELLKDMYTYSSCMVKETSSGCVRIPPNEWIRLYEHTWG